MPRCRLLDNIYFIHNCFYATQPYTLLEPKCLSTITYVFVHNFLLPYEATSPNTVAHCSGTVTPTMQTSFSSNLSIAHCTRLFLHCSNYCAYFFFPSPKYSRIFSLTNTHITKQFCFAYTCRFVPTLFFLTNTQPIFSHTTHVASTVE
jgi:hypothetical protein